MQVLEVFYISTGRLSKPFEICPRRTIAGFFVSQILIFVTNRVLFCHETLFVTERISCAKANR